MRVIHRLFAISIFIAFIIGCSDSNIPDSYHASLSGYSLNISNNKLSFDSNGGVENVTVHANNVAWRFSGLPEWLSVSPTSGSSTTSVTFTASGNLSVDTARTALFYLESADASWSFKTMVSATQQTAASYITPATTSLSFKGSGGSETINISSNVEWKPTSSVSWAKAEASSDFKNLTISVEENPTDASRNAIISLSSSSGITSSVNIAQEPAGVSGSTETLEFEKDGGSKSITITADAAWEIKTSDSWITVTPTSGDAGSHMITITVSENNSTSERGGNVYVNIGASSKLQIPIIQKGLYLEAKPTSLTFSADADSKQLEINSNTDWSVTSMPEWLTVSPQSGKNNQTISLTAQSNTSASSRNGKIKIEKEGLSLSVTVDVQQEGLTLSVDNNNLQFDANASTQNIVINTLSGWTASTSDGWITLSQTSGSGKSTLSISVEENKGEESRTGSVKIVAGELNQTITITQQGKYFNISESNKTFTSKGGTLQLSFSTNDRWTASIPEDVSWLTLSKTSGTGDAVMDITAGDNASMKARECTITITPSVGQGAKIKVQQAGRYLTIDTESVKFGADGGTSQTINISTDGTISISATDSWISTKELSQLSFSIVVPENEGKSRNGRVWISMTGLQNDETYELSIWVEQEGNDINGHEYVDLGLDSGTLWATCNLGATKPADKGYWYAWGESSPKTEFSSSSYVYSIPYTDVATKEWGDGWQTPTKEQMDELVNTCEWKPVYSGVLFEGTYVYGPNGKSIFLPACSGYDPYDTWSRYWTCTIYTKNDMAYHLRVDGGKKDVTALYRYFGAAIRPVAKR